MNMKQQRIAYVDIAKGLGILLVVWGHSSKFLFNEIYAFHMPLFFFIAGFFFKDGIGWKDFVYKKVKALLIPFIIFYTSTLLFYYSLLNMTGRGDQMNSTVLLDYIPLGHDILNTPLWFFYALFWMSVFYYLLRKYIRNNGIILGISVFLYGLNEVLVINEICLPMFINRSIGELIYMHLGFVFYNQLHAEKLAACSLTYKTKLVSLYAGVFVILYLLKTDSEIGAHILSPFVAICGTMTVIYLSAIIKNDKILAYLGKRSLVIFALHLPLFEVARPIAKRLFAIDEIGYDLVVFGSSLILAIVVGELFMLAFPQYLGISKIKIR